jgi:outer membrane lipoprotein carrier protein
MRIIFLIFNFSFLILLSLPLPASTTGEIVRQVQMTYEKANDVSSEFVQKVRVAALERDIEKTGKALFKKPGKLRVEYEGEEGRLYVSDGKKLWVYEKGDTQVNVYPVNPDTLPEEALAFLGGLGNLRTHFRPSALTKNERKTLKVSDDLDWLLLIPKNPASQLDQLILGFDRSEHTVREAFLKNESGNLSHYFFKNVVLNSGLEDEQFVFVKPKGVKEIKN